MLMLNEVGHMLLILSLDSGNDLLIISFRTLKKKAKLLLDIFSFVIFNLSKLGWNPKS